MSVFKILPDALSVNSSTSEALARKFSFLSFQPKVAEGEKALRLPSANLAE